MSNVILEQIHQVVKNVVHISNINQLYVEEDEPWFGIVAAEVFEIRTTSNGIKGYSLGQLILFRDMILPIKHIVNWELIRQQNQTEINKDNSRKNRNRVDHKYKVEYKVMLTNHNAYK